MKVVMLFPGYQSQHVGMAKELYDTSRIMQEYFEEASNCLNINFVKLCFASSEAELLKAENAYPSLFLVSSAIAALLFDAQIRVQCVAGYSVGQLSAICAAQGISFPDGLYFLSKYTQFYQEFLQTIDARVIEVKGLSLAQVQKYRQINKDGSAYIAAVASDHLLYISGYSAILDTLEEQLKEDGAHIQQIPVAFGLYSPLVNTVIEQLYVYSQKIDFKDLQTPLYTTLDGALITHSSDVKTAAIEQIRKTMRLDLVFEQITRYDVIIEVGPGTVLSSWIKQWYPDQTVVSVNRPVDIEYVQQLLANR